MLKIIIFIMLLISSVNAEIIKTNSLETITEKHAELLINYDAKDIMMIVAFRDTMFTPFFPEMKNVDKAIDQGDTYLHHMWIRC